MSDHSIILPESPTTAPAAAKDVMPAHNQEQNEYDIEPLQKLSIQCKLAIGTPDDPLEHEADAMADKIMRIPEQNSIQRKCAGCKDEEKLQRNPLVPYLQKKESTSGAVASPAISRQINSTRGSGSSMNGTAQSFMQSRFGSDFNDVKIHTDSEAIQMNRELNARAFTLGNDIYFNEGQYNPGSSEGKHLLAHELTHTIQQLGHGDLGIMRQPVAHTQAQLNTQCYQPGVTQPDPSAREPELHPTYERWLASFTGMTIFSSNDTAPGSFGSSFRVLGVEGAHYNDAGATVETESVSRSGSSAPADNFIDHPTNQWVQNCLPDNLRATAYQLPADCADIAVILRHVWLASHHRTETYNGWVVGDRSGSANQTAVRSLIVGRGSVYSGNVHRMVQPYANASGTPLLDFASLAPLLHPGDILVWRHINVSGTGSSRRIRRTGGHTQTINHIERSGAAVSRIQVLQGNQPIFSGDATAILQFQGARDTRPDSPRGHALRNSPGRRIEVSRSISIADIANPSDLTTQIWGRDDGPGVTGGEDFTILVAAGPPRSARRPTVTRGTTRSILNWSGSIGRASMRTIDGITEAMLVETRAIVEGGIGTPPTLNDMETLGRLTGERLRDLNRHTVDLLIRFRHDIAAVIQALRDDSNNVAVVRPIFNSFSEAFNRAAIPQVTGIEGQRLFTENTSIAQFLTPFSAEITNLATGLSSARNIGALRRVVDQSGLSLWQATTARAQATTGADPDDRPLYWTRIRMIEEIRNFDGRVSVNISQRQQLTDSFESASRGRTTVDFSQATTTQKKILISGFDPFGFNRPVTTSDINQTILDSNPSGAAVLTLDGQTISGAGGSSGHVQGVIFPVRYSDFDQNVVENLFRPFLNGTTPVSMIMTISQGGGTYEIERWAGRNRSATLPDNAGVPSGENSTTPVVPGGIGAGPEFLETQLPHAAMGAVPDTHLDSLGRSPAMGVAGPAVTGTGGGFLSNEIFYRVRLLQTNIGGLRVNIPVGHLHVPTEDEMTVNVIVDRIKAIISTALPVI